MTPDARLTEDRLKEIPRYSQWCYFSHGHQLAQQHDGGWMFVADVEALFATLTAEHERLTRENGELRTRAVMAEQHKVLDRMGRSSYQEVVEQDLRAKLAEAEVKAEALAARLAERDWQPIATAPKDGTRILAYQSDGQWKRRGAYRGERIECVYWHQPGNPEVARFWVPTCRPTHWMPLPSPPVKDGAQPPKTGDKEVSLDK